MDLKLIGATATTAEVDAIAAVVPGAITVELAGRVVRTERTALRHHLLPALDAVQSAIGYISPGAVDEIAGRLNIPPADIYAVATFYALLQTEPRPPIVAHVCDDTACRSAGGAELLTALEDRDDVISSPCLGQCDRRPAVFVQRAALEDQVITGASTSEVLSALGGEDITVPDPHVVAGPLLRRVGLVDPGSLEDYRAHLGYTALTKAIEVGAEAVITELTTSDLKGRGGAAFPAGIKWDSVRRRSAPQKYIVCNADESEPGTFKDRVVMEGDPFAVIEAMTIAGFATGATKGFIYVRGEYPLATSRLHTAISVAAAAGLLGTNVMDAGFEFTIELRRGQGAYICGEETALFNSIEGFRGEPRQKPPFPVESGLFGKPTVINNVETLINVLEVVINGGDAFAATGTTGSSGTRLFCLSGDVANPGVYEVEFGVSMRQLLEMAGGVVGEPRFILLGGAAGSLVDTSLLDLPLTFEDTRAAGVSLGSGVVMVFNHDVDMKAIVQRIARFFRDESCGQCVPCRVGTARIEEAVARSNGEVESSLIDDIDRAMKDASICGLGHTAATVVRSAISLGILGKAT